MPCPDKSMMPVRSEGHGLPSLLPLAGMIFVLWLLWVLSTRFLSGEFWQTLVVLAAVVVPLVLHGLYEGAIAKTLRRERYLHDGRFFRLFSGRLLVSFFTLVMAVLAGPFLVLRLHVLDPDEWLLLALLVPLQFGSYLWFRQLLRNEYKPWLLVSAALDWSRFVCPTLLAIAYALLLVWQRESGVASELPAALELAQRKVADIDSSVALAMLAKLLALLDGSKAWFMANLGNDSGQLVLWAAVLDFWLVCYLLCRALSVVLLPPAEWRRIFGPLTDSIDVPELATEGIALASALFTFALVFVGLPLLVMIESEVRARPQLQQMFAETQVRVERIGEEYFAPGTIAALAHARQSALASLEVSRVELRTKIDLAFVAMEGNVDKYLDWYYSLGGEYARTMALVSGDMEDYMKNKFGEMVGTQALLVDVENELAESLAGSAQANALYQRLRVNLLAQNRLASPGPDVLVVQQIAANDAVQFGDTELASLQNRLLSSGGGAIAGAIGGVIAGKLMAKVVTKGTFKLAAKAAAKLVASKSAGASLGVGAGAAAGGAIGSVVPGIGTVLGALVGGVIGGLAVGVGIDKALIEFEEATNRERYRADLLQTLQETRLEYLGATAAGKQ